MDVAHCKKIKFIYLFIDSNNLLIIEPQFLLNAPLFIYDLCWTGSTDSDGSKERTFILSSDENISLHDVTLIQN